MVKLFDEVKNAALVKQLSPGTLVIGRLFPGSVPDGVLNNGSPADRANDWWNAVKATILTYPAVDYWEGLNEPVVTSASTMSWYAQFEIARVNILAANGRKACIGNFATGNPDLALWPSFIPAIDQALAKGGIMGLHEYGTPMTQLWEEPAGEGWLCGRYRKVYRQHLQGREIPLVITETGLDEGTLAANGPGRPKPRPIDAQANHGWQQALGSPPVAGFPPPGDLAARKPWYLDQLEWYDGILKQDSYVLGATIYQLEIPGWASFDVRPLIQELTDYVAREGGVNASPTVSLSTDKTTATAPGSFVLTASASDPDGSISKVEFYQGSTLLSTDTTAPHSYSWSGVAAGAYDLTARAYDDAGASAVSNAIMVSVTVTPSPPTATDPGLVWLSDSMDAHGGGLVKKWSKWWSGTGNTEWNIVPGEGGWWAQEVKKSNVNVGISRPNRGFKPGDAYRLRFRARKTMGGGSPKCHAGVQPSGGALLWGASVSVTSTTSWVDVSYDFVASQLTTTLFLRADLTGLTDVGVAFDNVAVELVSARDPEPWMISGAPPVEPLNLHGIHDAGAEDLFVQANRKGWVTEALAIGSNPSDQSGHRFPQWIDGLGVIGRIAHLFGQILPAPGPAPQYPGLDAFAGRAANFVESSVGCGIWSIGNEPHLEGVQDPSLYAEAFVRAYRAIKAVRPQARVITAGFVHGDLNY
ncbi:MAG: Ig-like domain-containing protein, partial [Acidimicrobiia bacterium]